MKHLLMPLAALTFLSATAHAVSTVELTVTGLITPMACTPHLSGNGVVDFGKISRSDLNLDTGTRLPHKYLTLTVNCNAAGRFALRMRDNREGTAHINSEIFYGLGLDNSGGKIGVYSVSFDPKQTVVDDLPVVYGTESTTGGLAWRTANLNPIDIGSRSLLGFTDVVGSTAGPSAIQSLTSTLKLEATLNARRNLDLRDETPMNGSATLEVVYL